MPGRDPGGRRGRRRGRAARVVVPTRCGRPKACAGWACAGRRRPARPADRLWARAIARLAATVDLPSAATGEVTTQQTLSGRHRGRRSWCGASGTPRRRRCEAGRPPGCGCLAALNGGIVPTTGAPAAASNSSGVLHRAVEELAQKGQPDPEHQAKEQPEVTFSLVWGRTGALGVSAGSTRLTRRARAGSATWDRPNEGAGHAVGQPLGRAGSASSTLRSISRVSMTGSAWTFACSWLGVSGWGSSRSAASAVAPRLQDLGEGLHQLLGQQRSL